MKKITLGTIMLSSLALASCSLMEKESGTPKELLKNTQSNVIENMQDNVFSNKQVDFDGSLKLDVESPFGGGDGTITYDGQGSQEQAKMDLDLTGEFDIQGQSGNVDLSSSFLVTLDKIYMKLSKLEAQLPDPQLQAYLAMSQMIMDKWFYVENQATSQQISTNLRDLDLQEQFKEHNIFKIDNVIEDKKYNVSLHKDNLASIAYNVSKEVEPSFTGTKQEILTTMEGMDLTGVLDIKGDSYFTFSGSMMNGVQEVPFELRYLEDKLYLSMQGIILDIDKDGDNFDGTVGITQAGVNVNIDGKLTQKTFKLNVGYNQAPIKANANLIYNAKELDNVDMQIPEGATNLQEMIQNAMGGSMGGGLPQQGMPSEGTDVGLPDQENLQENQENIQPNMGE